MKNKNNKGVLIAGVIGAVVGTGALVYGGYNRYSNRKTKNSFNLLKLQEAEFLKQSLKQVDTIDEEVAKLKELLPTMIENIENELAINNPKKYAKTIEEYKANEHIEGLDIIVPSEVDNTRLDRLSNELGSLKKDFSFLYEKILKAYVTGNIETLKNENALFDCIDNAIVELGQELSGKLMGIEEE